MYKRSYKPPVNSPRFEHQHGNREFADQNNTIKAASFKSLLLMAVRSLHGEIAASANIFVRKFDEQKLETILMVPHTHLLHLWTSIITVTNLCDKACTLHVLQVSQHLMAIGNSSRQLSYPT
ncbi:P subunit p14-like isoform X2 [Octopus vulgaris]|uniref:P subunit p14-like isoform X2 n=1 Tax=Octopus vulgaris TaxID=6645 RepID=A0AA36ANX1_OCTVU|nr:P subunit p14-like isoform X2 [Octopus vulgaris]